MANYQIFISYRRSGSAELAQLLYTKLSLDGYRVFFDVETLRSGKFNEQLYSVIDQCSDVLLLLPPHGLDPRESGEDWVRLEIAHSLKQKKNIIPVLMRDFSWPETLPEDINEVRYRHGITASMEYFDAVYARLRGLLSCAPERSVPAQPNIEQKQLSLAATLLAEENYQDALLIYNNILAANLGCGEAYLGKLMAEQKIPNRERFRAVFQKQLLHTDVNFKLASEHADPGLEAYLRTLAYPQCANHQAVATHRCSRCGALICDDCTNIPPEDSTGTAPAPWPVGQTLCPDCLTILHAHSVKMKRRLLFRFICYFIVTGLSVSFAVAVALEDWKTGLLVLGISVLLTQGIRKVASFLSKPLSGDEEPEKKTDDKDDDFLAVIIGWVLKLLVYSLFSPIIILYQVIRRIYWWVRASGLLKANTRASAQDRCMQYSQTYFTLVSILRKLGMWEPTCEYKGGSGV